MVGNYKAEDESWKRHAESKLGIWGAAERKLGQTPEIFIVYIAKN